MTTIVRGNATRSRTRRQQVCLRSVASLASQCSTLPDAFPLRAAALLARDPVSGLERLVLGTGAVSYALRTQAENLTCLIAVLPLEDRRCEELAQLDAERVQDLDWRARVGDRLRRLPLALEDVSALLGLAGRPDAQRVCRLGQRPAPLRAAASAARITAGHLRYLTALDDAEFGRWVMKVRSGRLTIQKLKDAMEKGAAIAGDGEQSEGESASHDGYAQRISAALNTDVKIHWPANEAERSVAITWFTPEDLLGVMQKLVNAGQTGARDSAGADHRRRLTLKVRTLEELEAVFGLLGAEE